MRRPPRPTLVPYTTLFRSTTSGWGSRPYRWTTSAVFVRSAAKRRDTPNITGCPGALDRKSTRPELQSQSNLVCRLLLEQKKELIDNHQIQSAGESERHKFQ